MLSHKYAVQSFIALGSEYIPYVFLKGLNFQIWPCNILLKINKYLVHRYLFKKCQRWQVISREVKFLCKYKVYFKNALLGKKTELYFIISLLRSVPNPVIFNFLLRHINPNPRITAINLNFCSSETKKLNTQSFSNEILVNSPVLYRVFFARDTRGPSEAVFLSLRVRRLLSAVCMSGQTLFLPRLWQLSAWEGSEGCLQPWLSPSGNPRSW